MSAGATAWAQAEGITNVNVCQVRLPAQFHDGINSGVH